MLRPDTRETLRSFIKAGVRPKIISGDNPETVSALAQQAGLGADIKLVSGVDLAQMDNAAFTEAAVSGTIFGRITPQQKERLVQSLRSRGHYVAMIGDGVNDVLSLKQANLGVAMQSGSQATRGVADIVLMDDSFASLAPAVLEGQRIVNGMTDILRLYLARICTMGLLIVSSLVIGFFPLALRQGSLIVLLSVGIPTVALAIWARPGATKPERLAPQLVAFRPAADADVYHHWTGAVLWCLCAARHAAASRLLGPLHSHLQSDYPHARDQCAERALRVPGLRRAAAGDLRRAADAMVDWWRRVERRLASDLARTWAWARSSSSWS